MAGLIPAGLVVDPSRDVFPTTGAHLDVRVIPRFGPNQGKKIDPKTARTLLQNVLVGPNQTPLVQQKGKDWQWNFPITSGFGPRSAPTAGASSFHQGIDVPLSAGTEIKYKGYGTYRPEKGFGSLVTTDPQGNPYELRFLHTEPGKSASVGSGLIPTAPVLPGDTTAEDSINKLLSALGLNQQTQEPTIKDLLMSQALSKALQRRSELQNLASAPQQSFITPQQAMEMFS